MFFLESMNKYHPRFRINFQAGTTEELGEGERRQYSLFRYNQPFEFLESEFFDEDAVHDFCQYDKEI